MKTLKTLILFSFLFVCGMNASADNKSNLIYNSEEVNGMKVAETVYKMDGSTLANYMKYNYKYDDQKRITESEALKWNAEDGYLWFVGRADDVIKSSGYRIGPFEVESALMTHPAVIECAITGVPDEIRGQVVKATIVLSKDYKNRAGEELVKELQNHVKKVTAPYKYPRVIEFVDELPKTISGKIRRVEIRKNDEK